MKPAVFPSFLAVMLTGCTPMFVPNTVHAPMMERAGQIKVLGSAGTNGFAGSLAISPLKGFAVMGGVSRSMSDKEPQSDQESHGHEIVEGAVGGYLPSFELNGAPARVEGFLGIGKGVVKGNLGEGLFVNLNDLKNIEATYAQSFIQLGFTVGERPRPFTKSDGTVQMSSQTEYGTIVRLSRTALSDFSQAGITLGQGSQENKFVQICAFGRIGDGRLRMEGQAGILYPLADNAKGPTYGSFYAGLGLQFVIGPLTDED